MENKNRILIVDDEAQYVESLVEILSSEGYSVDAADTFETTLNKVAVFQPNLVVLDIDLKNNDGRDTTGVLILDQLRKQWNKEELPVLIISGTGNADRYFDVMQTGANDYLVKPVDFPLLLEKFKRLLNAHQFKQKLSAEIWKDHIVGRSKVIMNLAQNVFRAAQTDTDTLFLGETGTGKTLVANVFRQLSRRHDKHFVRIDINTIPQNLFEADIFGNVEGAFTDGRDKPGKIEDANGGIVFFDEIGDLLPEHQGKLLTLLENKTFTRVGANKPIRLDVTILMATNVMNLYERVKQGKFRKDLYYRLHNNVIQNPPLKDHREDIPDLVWYSIEKYNLKYRQAVTSVSAEVMECLQAEKWGGNVRELMQCVEHGVKNCLGHEIILRDVMPFLEMKRMREKTPECRETPLPADWEVDYETFKEKRLKCLHRDYLKYHLEKNDWNVAKTAQTIGITHYTYLNELMRRFDLRHQK